MEKQSLSDLVGALGQLNAMELVALTKQLENDWGVSATPQVSMQAVQAPTEQAVEQTEFNVMLTSVPADKKMSVIKAVREVVALGLKESKELVESCPKLLKEGVSKEDAEMYRMKLTEAGAVIEVK